MLSITNARRKVLKIRGILLANGMTFTDFAHKYGFNPRVVSNIVNRWAKHGNPPVGKVSKQIISKLMTEIEQITQEIARS